MTDIDKLYKLEMLEHCYINYIYITRVPGGWIFETESMVDMTRYTKRPVFVPYVSKYD